MKRSETGKWAMVAAVGLACAACANTTAVHSGYGDATERGMRYYLPLPYVLVSQPVTLRTEVEICANVGGQLTCSGDADANNLLPASDAGQAEADDAGDDGDGGDGDGGDGDGDDGKPAAATPAQADAAALKIVWLPDYCEQYAIRTHVFLAKNKTTLTLAGGWQLTGVNLDADSTAALAELVDLAKTLVTAKKDVDIEEIKAAAPPEDVVEAALTSGRPLRLQRTSIHQIRPGIYPLTARAENEKEAGCEMPYFEAPDFETEVSVSWSLLDPPG